MKKGIAKFTASCLAMSVVLSQVVVGAGTGSASTGPDTPLVGLSSTVRRVSAGEKQADGTIAQDNEGSYTEGTVAVSSAGSVTDKSVMVGIGAKSTPAVQEIAPIELTDDHIEAQSIEEGPEGLGAIVPDTAADTADGNGASADAASADTTDEAAAAPIELTDEYIASLPLDGVPEELDTSMVGSTGFAQCEEYLNVRTDATSDAEAVGKIYNNGSLEILDVTADGWYYIRSGNVEGYVSADYVAIGEAADDIAASSGYTTAQTSVDGLNVRADASTDAEVMATIDDSHTMEVVDDQGDWIKVLVDGEMYGYVSADCVSTSTEYATGETYEEEQARLDQEWLDYLAQQEAAAAAEAAAYSQSYYETTNYYDSGSYSAAVSTGGNADELASQAASLYQSYLTAQEAADAAVANGDGEQAIQDTAAAAISAYETYVSAQNAADAAAAGMYADTSAGSTYDGTSYSGSLASSASTISVSTSGSADELASQASSLYDNYLTAQAAADAAVANGEGEQAIQDTAAAAISAYEAYVTAQNAADAAAAGMNVDTSAVASTDGSGTASADGSQATSQSAETSAQEAQEATTSTASSAGQAIADYATQFVGNPYVYGGASLTGGADCSGFTMAVMANFGIGLPHNAAAQSGCGTPVSLDALQPGDLLFYDGGGGIGHVSIYIGGGQVVHASNPTNGILISSIGYRTPVAARRFV